jgi:putative NADH-flavin reductase
MHIAIIGASQGIGRCCVDTALERGHQVTTLSRSVAGYPSHPQLTVQTGDARRVADLQLAIQHADVVIVAIGTGRKTAATTIYTDVARALIEADRAAQRHLPHLVVTGFGAGDSGRYLGPIMGLLFRWVLADVYRNKSDMEAMIAASALRWTLVRPGLLTQGPATGHYRTQVKLSAGMKVGRISRNDVAAYLLDQAAHPTDEGAYVALSG